jgi:16S rRNA (adenine1518-N6/adenine1519-N6)-dimethyltransferase
MSENLTKPNLSARKSLGQHFLLDQNLTDRIVRAASSDVKDFSDLTIIEIGPGPGGLTKSLLKLKPKRLYAIERDQRYTEILKEFEQQHINQLTVINGDALKLKIKTLGQIPRRIIANLPYNISTALLVNWLRQIKHIEQMTLMFQKEVVDRIIAQPSCKEYGRLSIITQWLCKSKFEFHIDRRAFVPPPKVDSSLITLKPYSRPLYPAKFEFLEELTAITFGQRRKMLRSSLKPFGINIKALGIDQTARPENLSVEEFCLLAQALERSLVNKIN